MASVFQNMTFQGGVRGAVDPFGVTGGKKDKGGDDAPPPPPTAAEQAQQAQDIQIQNLPGILEAQQQYGSQFAQTDLDVLKTIAPQLANLTQQQKELLDPEKVAAQKLLAKYFGQEQGLSDTERGLIQEQSRAAQSVRGLAETGFGAVEEVRALADLRNQMRQQQLQLALGSVGQGSAGASNVAASSAFVPGRIVQNTTPSDIFGINQNNQNLAFNKYAVAQQARSDLLGGIIGAAGMVGGAAIGGPAGAAVGSQAGKLV